MIQESYVTFEELWKSIDEYENYQVSNLGNVRNSQGSLLKPLPTHDGYYRVALCKDGKSKYCPIHRLVAKAFIDNPNNYPVVDHINTIRTDNIVTNLRWCTTEENCNNPTTIEHHSGENHWQYGKHVSKETKLKISIAKKGSIHSEESKKKISLNGKRKHMKPVRQLTLNGEFIKEWECIQDASIALNINKSNIGQVALGNRNNAGGFKWEYVYDRK